MSDQDDLDEHVRKQVKKYTELWKGDYGRVVNGVVDNTKLSHNEALQFYIAMKLTGIEQQLLGIHEHWHRQIELAEDVHQQMEEEFDEPDWRDSLD